MSVVSFENFAKEFAEQLEISDDNFTTVLLKDVPEYDSMGKITASLLIEQLFDFEISHEKLDQSETLTSLYEFCVKNAEKNSLN